MPGTLQNKRSVCVSSRQRFLCTHGSAINLSVSLMIRFGKAMMSGVCRAAGFKCSIMIEAAIPSRQYLALGGCRCCGFEY